MSEFYYGGQAVIEGVMMRGRRYAAVAVRNPKGEIVVHQEPLTAAVYTKRWARWPFVRGISMLWDALVLGTRALLWSADVALSEEEDVQFTGPVAWTTVAASLLIAIVAFFFLPAALGKWIEHSLGLSVLAGAFVEGLIRLAFFLAYLVAIGRLPDIRRVFQYHGAEHMTIHAYEAREPLTIEAIRRFPKEHTRCGTSFLLVVVVVALAVFATFDALVDAGLLIRTASRILLVPVIAGVSYEILRLGARFERFTIVRWFFAPNIALQRLTTRVPDDEQIEVARAAFEATLRAAGLPIPGVREPAER